MHFLNAVPCSTVPSSFAYNLWIYSDLPKMEIATIIVEQKMQMYLQGARDFSSPKHDKFDFQRIQCTFKVIFNITCLFKEHYCL